MPEDFFGKHNVKLRVLFTHYRWRFAGTAGGWDGGSPPFTLSNLGTPPARARISF